MPAQRRDRILTRISEARSAVPGRCGWTCVAVCTEVSGLGFRAEWSTGGQRVGVYFEIDLTEHNGTYRRDTSVYVGLLVGVSSSTDAPSEIDV